jgi:hypothetical protein
MPLPWHCEHGPVQDRLTGFWFPSLSVSTLCSVCSVTPVPLQAPHGCSEGM